MSEVDFNAVRSIANEFLKPFCQPSIGDCEGLEVAKVGRTMPSQQTIERKAVRTATKFTGEVTVARAGTSRGTVKDFIGSGSHQLSSPDSRDAKTGQEVSIKSEQFGHI